MEDERRGLLSPEPTTEVRWTAVDSFGSIVGEIHVDFLERAEKGYLYSARYGYHDGQETVIKQRTFTVPSWQSLNVMGILLAALTHLRYEELNSDEYPDLQWARHGGRGSAFPRMKDLE